uniref:NADH-ubiquinone oxidoreductase chain 2 n=1 Tax=Oligolophus tienmushanensis TaxID=1508515 RepID=A0A140X736_9ARAC|nr:NADH dehydrogenase subunit 2 [Oligolophus tienmushanensis]AIG60121.1 NADH dehydrogenase subunit 2 [Oligolophus tienmushanensis]
MLMKPTNLPFITMMVLGSMISISANSWFPIWLGLEMNIMGFIPLIVNKSNIFSIEASLKYFLVQAISSSILLLSSIQNNFFLFPTELINMSLLIKLGAAPFHFWVPSIAGSISWSNLGLFLTWQKLAPMMILTINMTTSIMMMTSLILSLMFGPIGGLSQTNMKKMLAFSSIAHMGWVITTIMMSFNLVALYFVIYSTNLLMVISMMKNFQISSLNNSTMLSKKSKIMLYSMMLNMGGMPPLLGFFPKLMTLTLLIKMNMILLCLPLLTSAIINLFFYLRLTYLALVLMIKKKNVFMYNYNTYKIKKTNYKPSSIYSNYI